MKRVLLVRAMTIVAISVALILHVSSIVQQSFTADEPYFLFAGYRAVRFGQNTLNLEHPPLVGMIAALPFAHISSTADQPYPLVFATPSQSRRIRLSSRLLVWIVFALPLLWCCVSLGRELVGVRTGLILMLLIASSFNVFPYFTIVQTDTAATLSYLVTLTAGIRFVKVPSMRSAIWLGLCFGLALATKFSGLLLLPVVLLVVSIGDYAQLSWKRRLGCLCVIVGLSGIILHLTYRLANWNYESAIGRQAIQRYCASQATLVVDDQMRRYEPLLLSLERFAPMEAQWLTGVLGVATQNRIGIFASHALNAITSQGRWWFFPLLFFIRTPLVLLIAWLWSLFSLCVPGHPVWQRLSANPMQRRSVFVLLVTIGVYGGTAILSNYNLGLRHLLPIIPFLMIPVAVWASQRFLYSGALVGFLLAEAIAVAPLWMTTTNTWWLGERNPTYCAVITDCEYRQNFLALAAAAHRRGIVPLHIAFPLFIEAERKSLTPEAIIVDPKATLPPGWHAVDVIIERFLPIILQTPRDQIHNYDTFASIAQEWSAYTAEVRRRGIDHGHIAGTFHLYYVPS
jgi:4-amino-4-deoxy-L-arabinose transferase-like glycosyltransferase